MGIETGQDGSFRPDTTPVGGGLHPLKNLITLLVSLRTPSAIPWSRIMSDVIKEIEKELLRDDLPEFAPGDTIKVLYLVREGAKERVQAFEGVCIARKHGGLDETFTVRKIASGVGVERIFPLQAPTVSGIEVVRRGRVRRAKLYYLRGRRGKSAKIPEKRTVR